MQYATDRQYLCNALINVKRLIGLDTTCELVVLVPARFFRARPQSPVSKLLASLKERNVVLASLSHTSLITTGAEGAMYVDSLQKLSVLGMQGYDVVVYFDNDGLVLRNLDDLASQMPRHVELAVPRAYYTESNGVSSAFMVIRPSEKLARLAREITRERSVGDYDMEVINQMVQREDVVSLELPYSKYLLLTGIFRDHTQFDKTSEWDARKVIEQASYIHFSDSPIPKPWVDDRGAQLRQHGPRCQGTDCENVVVWKEVYRQFRDEMRASCPSLKELD